MAFRFDTIRIDAKERLPNGAVVVAASPTRSGVFEYREVAPSGASRVVREWRPPAEVARADSLATLEDAAVTIGHPKGDVTPRNARDLAKGHVRAGSVKAETRGDDVYVGARFVLTHQDAIDPVERGDLHDVSLGYALDIDPTPGVTPQGERYDRVQRNIRYNHAALLPKGDGRMGTECALRLDSAGEQITNGPENPGNVSDENPHATNRAHVMKIKITRRSDGKTVEVEKGSDEHIAILEANEAAAVAAADTATARADAADRQIAGIAAEKARAARADLETKAKAHGVSAFTRKDSAGAEVPLSNREVMIECVKRYDSAFNPEGQSDAYVLGYFEALKPAAPSGAAAEVVNTLNGKTPPAPPARADAADAVPDKRTDPRGYARYMDRKHNGRH